MTQLTTRLQYTRAMGVCSRARRAGARERVRGLPPGNGSALELVDPVVPHGRDEARLSSVAGVGVEEHALFGEDPVGSPEQVVPDLGEHRVGGYRR